MALFQQASEVKGECEGGVLGEVQLNQPRRHCTGAAYPTYQALTDSSNSVGNVCG